MMGKVDPWVNMLRGTVAAFAAGVGGADAVTVIPFDERLGLPDALGRRIARNTSSLLIEESHVAAVTDPAGGSYAVEKLTDDLAVAGWAELGRIEADGGFGEQAARGVQGTGARGPRRSATRGVADRSRPLTGISEFPNLAEVLPEREPWSRGERRPLRLGLRGPARRARVAPGLPRHDGPDRRAHRARHLRHQPVRRGRRRRRGGRRHRLPSTR